MIKLFGFTIGRDVTRVQPDTEPALALPNAAMDDGAVTITANAHYGTYVDMEGSVRNDIELISRYREMANHPELEMAIDEIVNEAITRDQFGNVVEINMDKLDLPENIKKKIADEFNYIQKLLNFKNIADDLFKRWYIDGRLFYQVLVDEKTPESGITELRYIDPRKIRKIREINKDKDPKTGAMIIKSISDYYAYSDTYSPIQTYTSSVNASVRIAPDSIINVNSGLMDAKNTFVISFLHKCIKPLNQLRMIEDAVVIYRLSRAPERRIFYIDVGNLPKGKAEQYMKEVMTKYRNKMVYDACLSLDTKIPLLDGRDLTLQEIINEHNTGKELWAYSCDPNTGEFAPGIISWAGVTKKNQQVVKIILDNDKEIVCTPDHKFPTWDKGFVEAKDLIPGESMIPFYRRDKKIYGAKHSTYSQIFKNNTKKWEYTHRLVSTWKDYIGIENEYTFNADKYLDTNKKTIHHINYDRYNNSPNNLTRMFRNDHFEYHKQHCSLAGQIGGKITAENKRKLNLPFFNITKEDRIKNGRLSGKIGGAKSYANRSGIHGLSKETTRKNSITGNKKLSELLKDKEFNTEFRKKIRDGWTDDIRDKFSKYGKLKPIEHFSMMGKLGNNARWGSEDSEASRAEHSKKQTIIYPDNITKIVIECAKDKLNVEKTLENINNIIDLHVWSKLNENKHIRNRKSLDEFTQKDLTRICKTLGFAGYKECKDAYKFNNHKIVSIEYLPEPIDVGTLTIDREEVYHNYHTFALCAGVYTKNSTGELRDDRKHLSLLEDFWLPRREGGKGTEITTLPAGQNLGQMQDVDYFRKKLLNSLNVPISRLEPQDGGMIGVGRSTEVTRDEVKFSKFIQRLRIKFSRLFDDALGIQLALKNICTKEEWEMFKEDIFYDYKKDNNFTELRDAELLRERLQTLELVEPYIGKYFSVVWTKKNILKQTDEQIEKMFEEMEIEESQGITSLDQDNQMAELEQQEAEKKHQLKLKTAGNLKDTSRQDK